MGEKVSREAAVAALIAQPTIKGAAEECGISEKTLHAWLKEPDFASKVRAAQAEITRATMGRVLSTVGTAIDTLAEVMAYKGAGPGPRVASAKALLEHSLKVYELEAVQQRLDEMERRLHA